MLSKWPGTCAICNSGWAEGDDIWWQKDCATICMPCHNKGLQNPGKASNGGGRSNGGGGGGGGANLSIPVLKEILAVLNEIRDLLQVGSGPSAEPPIEDPEPEAGDSQPAQVASQGEEEAF